MKQMKLFTRGMCIGKSRGYNDTIQLLRTLYNINPGGRFTAYDLAKMSGYSARHINRMLLDMFGAGKVDFVATVRRGKPAREWYAK